MENLGPGTLALQFTSCFFSSLFNPFKSDFLHLKSGVLIALGCGRSNRDAAYKVGRATAGKRIRSQLRGFHFAAAAAVLLSWRGPFDVCSELSATALQARSHAPDLAFSASKPGLFCLASTLFKI